MIQTTTTFDEPIKETILRDFTQIFKKFTLICNPSARNDQVTTAATVSVLKDWELWGPMILSIALCLLECSQSHGDFSRMTFGLVFMMSWCGAAIVALNSVLVGSTASALQCLSVVMYGLTPIVVVAGVCLILPSVVGFLKIILLGGANYFATGVTGSYLNELVKSEKSRLVEYPAWLYYLSLSWVILIS